MNSQLQYPHLAKHAGLDHLASSTGVRVYSPAKGSPQSSTNRALGGIERDHQNPMGYINNRVSEWLCGRLLQVIVPSIWYSLSTIVNDIRYGVDLILQFDNTFYAVDVTKNKEIVQDKLARRTDAQGRVQLIGPDNGLTTLPFLVIYFTPDLVVRTAQQVNSLLKNNTKKLFNDILIEEIQSYLQNTSGDAPIICVYGEGSEKLQQSIESGLNHMR